MAFLDLWLLANEARSTKIWIERGVDRKLNSPTRLGEFGRVELNVGMRKSQRT